MPYSQSFYVPYEEAMSTAVQVEPETSSSSETVYTVYRVFGDDFAGTGEKKKVEKQEDIVTLIRELEKLSLSEQPEFEEKYMGGLICRYNMVQDSIPMSVMATPDVAFSEIYRLIEMGQTAGVRNYWFVVRRPYADIDNEEGCVSLNNPYGTSVPDAEQNIGVVESVLSFSKERTYVGNVKPITICIDEDNSVTLLSVFGGSRTHVGNSIDFKMPADTIIRLSVHKLSVLENILHAVNDTAEFAKPVVLRVHANAQYQRFINVLDAFNQQCKYTYIVGIEMEMPDGSIRGIGRTSEKKEKKRRISKVIVDKVDIPFLSEPIKEDSLGAQLIEEIRQNYKLMHEYPRDAFHYCSLLESALNEYVKLCGESQVEENEYLPNIFFLAVKANAEMAQLEPDKANEYRAKALNLCETFMKYNFSQSNPERMHDLSATIKSMAAGLIFDNEIEDRYVQAVNWYEEAAKEAIAMPEGKGREIAANCYLRLVRCYRICLKPGEDANRLRARRDSYINSFWMDVDKDAPNRFALQMVVEHLNAVELAEDKSNLDAYNAAIAKAEEIIKREAGQTNAVVEDVYNAICALVAEKYESEFGGNDFNALAAYVDGFAKAPELGGISAQAALTMSKVNILQESAVADKDKLIEKTLNDMDQQYRTKINQLSAEVCYCIAQTLLNMAETNKDKVYKSEMAKRTYPYYDRALITKDSDLLPLVYCGKAKALTIGGGFENAKEAYTLYDMVLASGADDEVINMARFGKADSLHENKEYDALIKLATAYLADDSSSSEAIDMYNMLADAYKGKGDSEKAIDVYYNLYRDNLGTVSVSAPACKKMMEMLYDRNEGFYKDNGNGTFRHGDRWTAWYRGKSYCDVLKSIYHEMTVPDKILYDAIKELVATYEKDAKVQDEKRKEAADRAKY